MILENIHSVKTNLTGSVEFTVSNDSAKIFSLLSNFLYKDKERSVLTELSSNALDAHKMVGKESEPISITLPTSLSKEVVVRDYGPGLSENHVYEFLTKFGASSKGETNDFIGGFGIGSKSPASVTDSWRINSYHAGEVSSYLIHINDKGIPNINKLYTNPTQENGLEVIIPTKNNDGWVRAAQLVYEHYEVTPTFKGGYVNFRKFEFEEPLHGDLYLNPKNSSSSSYKRIYVLMNRRAYLVDTAKLSSNTPPLLFDRDVYLPFQTSELSVSLSREDIQYDSTTIEKISNRILSIKEKLLKDWKREVSIHDDSIFQYQMEISKFKVKYHVVPVICRNFATAVADKFASNVDFERLNVFKIEMSPIGSAFLHHSDKNVVRSVKENYLSWRTKHGNKLSFSVNRLVQYNSPKIEKPVLSFTCSSKDDVIFMNIDVKDGASRVKYHFENGHIQNNVVLLTTEWFNDIPDCFEKVNVSTLPKKPREARVKRADVVSELYQLHGRHFEKFPDNWVDLNKKYVAIEFSNATSSSSIINEFDRKFVSSELCPARDMVFIKRKSKAPSFTITPKEYIEQKFNAINNKLGLIETAFKRKALSNYRRDGLVQQLMKSSQSYETLIDKNSIFGKVFNDLKMIGELSQSDLTLMKEFDILIECGKLLNKPVKNINELADFTNILIKEYPMLEFCMINYLTHYQVVEICNYVKSTGK